MTMDWQQDLTPPTRLPDEPCHHTFQSLLKEVGKSLTNSSRVNKHAIVKLLAAFDPAYKSSYTLFGYDANKNVHHVGIELGILKDYNQDVADKMRAFSAASLSTRKIYPTSYDNWYREFEVQTPKIRPPRIKPRRSRRRR